MNNYNVDLVLLDAVKRRPILWDAKSDDYKHSQAKPAVWAEIAAELGSTTKAVMARFANMRTAMRRRLVAISQWKADGCRGECPNEYKYADRMAFLHDSFAMKDPDDVIKKEADDSSYLDSADVYAAAGLVLEAGSETGNGSEELDAASSPRPAAKRQKRLWYGDSPLGDPDRFPRPEPGLAPGHGRTGGLRSRDRPADDDDDDDWLFCRRVYNKLRAIGDGFEKERWKCRVDAELLGMRFPGQDSAAGATRSETPSAGAAESGPGRTSLYPASGTFVLYKSPAVQQDGVLQPVQMVAPVVLPSSNSNEKQ